MNEHSWQDWLWIILSALAGSVASLIFRPYKKMSSIEIVVSLFVSFTFAIFFGSAVAEYIVEKLFGAGHFNIKAYGAVMWLMAAVSFVVIPVIMTRTKKWANDKELPK